MHFMLPSSGAPRWGKCPGSVLMEAVHPDVETDEAREGTASHWVMEQSLNTMKDPAVDWRNVRSYVDETAPNGVVINEDMADGAGLMVTEVARICNQHGAKRDLMVELRVKAPAIHGLQGGTLDVALFVPGHLYVYDYKYGHLVVEAEENEQLICYFAGLMERFGWNGLDDQHIIVHFVVVQPRAYHRDGPVREWTIKASDLRAHINHLHHQAHAAMQPNAPTKAGPQCLHCKARFDCETNQRSAQAAMVFAGTSQRLDMRPEDVANELRFAEQAYTLLKSRLSGLQEYAQSLISQGTQVNGWATERGKGRKRWKSDIPVKQIVNIAKMNGVDIAKLDALTPTQALNKGLSEQVVESFSETPLGATKLVPVEQTTAFKAFNRRG